MTHEMSPEDREEFEENRNWLIEVAQSTYKVTLEVNDTDGLNVEGTLNNVVDFYGDYRSEIEEML